MNFNYFLPRKIGRQFCVVAAIFTISDLKLTQICSQDNEVIKSIYIFITVKRRRCWSGVLWAVVFHGGVIRHSLGRCLVLNDMVALESLVECPGDNSRVCADRCWFVFQLHVLGQGISA